MNSFLGRVEVSISSSNNNRKWRPICGDGWGVREAMVSEQYDYRRSLCQFFLSKAFKIKTKVKANSSCFQVVCRELGLHFAQAGTQTDMFNPSLFAQENVTDSKTDVVCC